MRKIILILFINGILFSKEYIIKVPKIQNERFYEKKIGISIVKKTSSSFIAVSREEKLKVLEDNGIDFEIVQEIYEPLGQYLTYQQIIDSLNFWKNQYPNISKIDTVGYSVLNRLILCMKISDNPNLNENEPRIKIGGSIHGNEKIGGAVCMHFIKYLLSNYGSNQNVKNLVDSREIYVIPLLNPDGYVSNTRYNANGVDLNRDFGFMWDGWGGSSSPFSQIESKYIHEYTEKIMPSLDFNYHSSPYVGDLFDTINYLWDYHPHDPPDSIHIINLSEDYDDSTGYGITNGYDWYQVCGSLQDAVTGIIGGLAWTIECPYPFNGSSLIDSVCKENRRALLSMCLKAGYGFGGNVYDSITGTPLFARIEILNPVRIYVYSSPLNGFYFKALPQGNYQVRACANGYSPKTVNVQVPSSGSVTVNFYLNKNTNYRYAFKPVYVVYANHAETGNYTLPFYSLGEPDSKWYSLGNGGEIVLDMYDAKITDVPGFDFTVYEGSGLNEGYYVYLSNQKYGPWTYIGVGYGTKSFDISGTGISEARYIRIVDDGDNSSGGVYAGFDLDAVYSISATKIYEFTKDEKENYKREFKIVDLTGRVYKDFKNCLRPGIYFLISKYYKKKEIKKEIKIK
jgi:hypothetical protein